MQAQSITASAPQATAIEHQCHHCGWIGRTVRPQSVHVGGHGYMTFNYCLDRELCWKRWEVMEAHRGNH
jgi:hypothetical protein